MAREKSHPKIWGVPMGVTEEEAAALIALQEIQPQRGGGTAQASLVLRETEVVKARNRAAERPTKNVPQDLGM